MNIKEKFLALTSKTYPYGFEDELVSFLPPGYFNDKHGNYYYKIGESRTAFTSHLDTACKDQVDVVHVFDGKTIKTNGKSILGADDKAGVTILLYMIEKKVPGLYCFFFGEEVGCIGSGLASTDSQFLSYDRMIAFDRRGTTSIITHQSSKRCCSDKFGKELANRLNQYGMSMITDDTGVYTDSAEFISVIPECTNISVGYYSEHTHTENQDISHLIKICNAVTKIDWESLPIVRDPKVIEYKPYKCNSGWDYNYSSRGGTKYNKKKSKDYSRTYGYNDDWYDQNTKWNKNQVSSTIKGKVYLNDIQNEIFDSFDAKSKAYYESLKQIIFDDKITSREFDIIKDNYLDMDDPSDIEFFNEMKAILC
jgi:hypothetical protein